MMSALNAQCLFYISNLTFVFQFLCFESKVLPLRKTHERKIWRIENLIRYAIDLRWFKHSFYISCKLLINFILFALGWIKLAIDSKESKQVITVDSILDNEDTFWTNT